jgi:hypothetical protein
MSLISKMDRACCACRADTPVRQNTTATRQDGMPALRSPSTTFNVGEMSSSEKLDGRKMTSEAIARSRFSVSCCPRVSITTSSH